MKFDISPKQKSPVLKPFHSVILGNNIDEGATPLLSEVAMLRGSLSLSLRPCRGLSSVAHRLYAALAQPTQWLTLFCLLVAAFSTAQNLVPNPGFEAFNNCPPYPGQIHESIAWDSPNNNTTDYFHRCAPSSDGASVPKNLLGTQQPAQGDAYAGIRTWIPVIPGNPLYREYLSVQLTEPLQGGVEYAVQFQVSLAEESSHATNDLGVFFSKTPFENERLYQVIPQIQNPEGNILINSTDWTTISGTFVAEGGETFLVIGTFLDDVEMTRVPISENEEPKVYYYIDEVKVAPCIVPNNLTKVIDTTFCEDSSIELFGLPDALSYQWENRSSTESRLVTEAEEYSVVSQMVCYDFTTIYIVKTEDCRCQSDLITLQLLAPNGRLALSTNAYTQITRLTLFDVLGRMITKLSPSEIAKFNTYFLAAGAYFYQIEYDCLTTSGEKTTGRQTGKVVITR